MYTAFYGLREKPFVLSPDPRFLYLAGSHREALAHLLYGIEQGEGFISVTGEVGTGKTTLCRTLLERLDGDTELAFLFNPSRTALELLQSICAEFGLPAEGLNRRTLMAQLNAFLVAKKSEGKRVLLIIDEAQTLSENTLEQVRLLSNLETSRDKLIQILLLGQPELDRKLDERGLRQLRQRISVRWKLDPLGPHETRAYVRHRLSVAAGEPKDLFSESALREVHRRTGGIPRLVNQLCDRALLAGYAARAAQIGPRLVRAAAREIPDTQSRRPRPHAGGSPGTPRRGALSRPWLFFGASLALVGCSLFAGLQVGRSGLTDSMRAATFKPAALRTEEGARSEAVVRADLSRSPRVPPAVGANAPNPRAVLDGTTGEPIVLGHPEAPPVAELIGYVPPELLAALRPLPDGLPPSRPGEASGPGAGPEGDPNLAPSGEPGRQAEFVAAGHSFAIPARPHPEETALAAGLLPTLLAKRDATHALEDSRAALLGRFDRLLPGSTPPPSSPADLQRSLERRGLVATPFDGGSIALLRRLDHPVAIPLARNRREDAPGRHRWIAITGFKRDRARVAGLVPDQIVTIPIADLEAHWLETGIIVWERYESIPPVLVRDDEGPAVDWLQTALAELDFLDPDPDPATDSARPPVPVRFDTATDEALRRFQLDRGLVADGVAGPLTQIALYAGLERYPVPRLSAFQTPAPPPPPSAASAPSNHTSPRIERAATAPARPGDRG